MKNLSKRQKVLLYLAALLPLMLAFCWQQNNSIAISSSDYYNEKVPQTFENFKIVQISDLHNKMFGQNQQRLLSKIEDLSPDIIVITGDLVDRRRFNLETAMCFIKGAVKIAPVYYVSGNHEAWSGRYDEVAASLYEAGVHLIDDSAVTLKSDNSSIELLGLSDPDFLTSSYLEGTNISQTEASLKELTKKDSFKILLSHRPELFQLYCQYDVDLIFTGHAHGGQFRLPFLGGLIAPDQGLFPKYTSGSFTQGTSTMFVSRGLGNSIIPLRLFNRPEIIAVTLHQSL